MSSTSSLKDEVREFWNSESCGERYQEGSERLQQLEAQARTRYAIEPYLHDFARFETAAGRDVLEIGVGMGADHAEFAKAKPGRLVGVDLTPRAIEHTRERLQLLGLKSELQVADAERLPFPDDSFDIVYSYGVLHHSPDTATAFREVHRVLRPGGEARIMIYHRRSLVGFMLWTRYALMKGRPWTSLDDVYASHLESPGTKAYSMEGAKTLVAPFSRAEFDVRLGPGDLLEGGVGQRHRGVLLDVAKRLYPRGLIRSHMQQFGLGLLITATK